MRSRLCVSILALFAFLTSPYSTSQVAQAQEKESQQLSGAKFKNVTALADMPADQMGKAMNIMTASLGVNCQYCHEGTDFAKESVGQKDVGRKMIELTRELNAKYFEGRTEVTCFTCHQGNVHPTSTVPLGSIIEAKEAKTAPKTEPQPANLTVDAILTKYLDALGTENARKKLKSRHIIAKRVEPDGRTEPEELWQLSDGRFRMLTTYGTAEKPVAVVEGFDGKTAWKKANADVIQLKTDEAALIELDAKATLVSDLRTLFQDLRFRKTVQLEGQSAHWLTGTVASGLQVNLYFDAENGLLIRRTTAIPTFMGDFVHQVDYREYKVFDELKVPTRVEYSVPNIRWTRAVTAVEHNQAVDNVSFVP